MFKSYLGGYRLDIKQILVTEQIPDEYEYESEYILDIK
jgi:hypothetical protein